VLWKGAIEAAPTTYRNERERELENINFVVPFLVLVCKEQGRCISYLDFCIIRQEYSERAQGG